MTAQFNHTIIASTDPQRMAEFYTDLLEAKPAPSWGPFCNISLDGGVLPQFATPPIDFPPQHYAFLLNEAHFDRAYQKICLDGARALGRPATPAPRSNQS